MPPRPLAFLKWLPGYFLPWNLLFAASAVAYALFVLPDVEVMKTLAWGWILRLFIVNCVAVFLFYSAFEYRLYMRGRKETGSSTTPNFPMTRRTAPSCSAARTSRASSGDLERRADLDGLRGRDPLRLRERLRALALVRQHPLYLGCLALIVPIFHEFHFFCIHRLIHWPPLYRSVHSVHHHSVNPSPWSSLSMHPVEQLLYFSSSLIHVIIPSNPVLAIYQLHYAGFGAVVGHIGFDKIETGKETAFDSHAYGHYLHHKYFEVNYGDGLVPLDKLFGTWHDGSPEAEARMNARYEKRKARMNAVNAAS